MNILNKLNMKITYGKNVYSRRIKAVLKQLKITTQMGSAVNNFENLIKEFSKKFGLMCNSGSSAIMLSLKVLDFNKGDEVITPCLNLGPQFRL